MKVYAPFVLRMGIAIVFLWFGVNQVMSPENWVGFVPDAVVLAAQTWFGFDAAIVVLINGAFEIIFGLCLFFAFFIRTAATLLALHMAAIVLSVGMTPTGVRDFGITVATIAVALYGKD